MSVEHGKEYYLFVITWCLVYYHIRQRKAENNCKLESEND